MLRLKQSDRNSYTAQCAHIGLDSIQQRETWRLCHSSHCPRNHDLVNFFNVVKVTITGKAVLRSVRLFFIVDNYRPTLHIGLRTRTHTDRDNRHRSYKGSSIKDVRKKWPLFIPSSPCPQVSVFYQAPPPLWTSAFSIIHCSMVWQRNSWCCQIRCSLISSSGHFTPTPSGLICESCN